MHVYDIVCVCLEMFACRLAAGCMGRAWSRRPTALGQVRALVCMCGCLSCLCVPHSAVCVCDPLRSGGLRGGVSSVCGVRGRESVYVCGGTDGSVSLWDARMTKESLSLLTCAVEAAHDGPGLCTVLWCGGIAR